MKKTEKCGFFLHEEEEFYDLEHMNENFKIADSVLATKEELLPIKEEISNTQAEIKTLKDGVFNNMTNNVFLETFDTLDSVRMEKGIYDSIAKKIYI